MADADAALVIDICRRLDGIALAIELAAGASTSSGCAASPSVSTTASACSPQGRRTALPRHKTLGATIDWSYELLSEAEQTVFARLGTMAGSFSLDSAAAVAAGDGIDEDDAIEAVASLVGEVDGRGGGRADGDDLPAPRHDARLRPAEARGGRRA